MLEESPIQVIGCTREDCAGSRPMPTRVVNGMGAVAFTYCVGGLSICNSVAGAFAEKSPVWFSPDRLGSMSGSTNPLLHHKVRDFGPKIEVFEKLCIAVTELIDPLTAFQRNRDRVLDACHRFKRPVYIELPRDMVPLSLQSLTLTDAPTRPPMSKLWKKRVKEAHQRLSAAKKPVIIAGN